MENEPTQNLEENAVREINILEATREDLRGIIDVHEATWLATYPNEQHGITRDAVMARIQDKEMSRLEAWIESLEHQDDESHVWVAKDGERVIGFCHAVKNEDGNFVKAVYVLAEYQAKHIGSKLMNQAIDWLGRDKDVVLNVVSYNEPAIAFYERLGFIRGAEIIRQPDGSSTWLNMPEIEMRLPAQSKDRR